MRAEAIDGRTSLTSIWSASSLALKSGEDGEQIAPSRLSAKKISGYSRQLNECRTTVCKVRERQPHTAFNLIRINRNATRASSTLQTHVAALDAMGDQPGADLQRLLVRLSERDGAPREAADESGLAAVDGRLALQRTPHRLPFRDGEGAVGRLVDRHRSKARVGWAISAARVQFANDTASLRVGRLWDSVLHRKLNGSWPSYHPRYLRPLPPRPSPPSLQCTSPTERSTPPIAGFSAA